MGEGGPDVVEAEQRVLEVPLSRGEVAEEVVGNGGGAGADGAVEGPHLFVQQKRGSVHANYSEPEVDGWIRRHNDALAAQTGAEAQRGAYPDVEQVAAYH